jgi:CBS domain containing-hemolysin-like protein
LAQGIFSVAKDPVSAYATTVRDVPRARPDMTKEEMLQLARRHRAAAILVEDADDASQLAGYVRVIDLGLDDSGEAGPLRPLLTIRDTDTQLATLMRMQSAKESFARVIDAEGNTVGMVTAEQLRRPLLPGDR